jgi:hypothetical protein
MNDKENIIKNKDKKIVEATIIDDDQNQEEKLRNTQEKKEIKKNTKDEDKEISNKKIRSIFGRYKKNIKNNLAVINGLLFGVIISYALYRNGLLSIDKKVENGQQLFSPVYIATMEEDIADIFYFEKFIILKENENKQSYVILNIALIPSNGKVYKEVKEKLGTYRAVIFEILEKEINSDKEIVEEKLKEKIVLAMNEKLNHGKIEKIIFEELLKV